MEEEIAFLGSQGVDVFVTTTSQVVALPRYSGFIIIKNAGTAEAFVKGLSSNTGTVTASAASGMSILPGTVEVYRLTQRTGGTGFSNVAVIGTAATTLRIYCPEGV